MKKSVWKYSKVYETCLKSRLWRRIQYNDIKYIFTIFTITGGLIMTSFAVILGSLSFWLRKSDTIADIGNSFITHFATYPEGIFKDITRILLYTIIPIGIVSYIPIKIINEFNPYLTIIIGLLTIVLVIIAFIIFNRGLKRYSSSNLMIARI